jgi:hypothetical protein
MDGFRSGGRIQCRFNLAKEVQGSRSFNLGENAYHILLARGPVDEKGEQIQFNLF